jgi:hypothetical protein
MVNDRPSGLVNSSYESETIKIGANTNFVIRRRNNYESVKRKN